MLMLSLLKKILRAVTNFSYSLIVIIKSMLHMRLLKCLFTKKNPNLSTGFSALFICTNKLGNKFLSQCEDPTHSEWKSGNIKIAKTQKLSY